jgi:ferredoxin
MSSITELKLAFEDDPRQTIEQAIKQYVANSPANIMPGFEPESIWDAPLVGFADPESNVFQEYKTIIGDFHMTPREALQAHVEAKGFGADYNLSQIGVVSWVLPSTRETRMSMRVETEIPSLRWNRTRWYGQDLNFKLARHVVSLIESMGYEAVAPESMKPYEVRTLPDGHASNWSQRHVAYVAGLGTFSLSDGFITPKGVSVRLGSVVCNVALPATGAPATSHVGNCLHYRDGSCGECIYRCPAGAISREGHDKLKCREYLFGDQLRRCEELGKRGDYLGRYLGCGLCQTGVACEAGIPA